ncbi:MAG: 4'-phosphopantetheinyl transferase superfamily protein [Bacteroidetes bacterium]|jgi:4'-phosphopantetheinyl transferase|nr:4'-phosphopantetheinyl transferase superfamily protein [Bacteroidota bacterium]
MHLPDDIWLRRLTFDAAQAPAWRSLLSDEERARYDAFPVTKRQREFLLGRVALRTLLADRLDRPASAIALHVTDAGAVEVPEAPYFVSIAHSGDQAVAAVSPHRVGVDLEHVRPVESGVIDFVLRRDERDLLNTLPMGRDRAFILCWTLKEATLKALHTGFLRSPKKVRLEIAPGRQRATTTAWDESVWTVRYVWEEAFWLSVAYPARAGRPTQA